MIAKLSWPWRLTLVIVFTLVGAYVVFRITLRAKVAVRLNAIHKQGYPVMLAELEDWYPQVPQAENAAEIYLRAFQQIVQEDQIQYYMFSNLTAQLPARGQHLDAAAVRDTKALLVRQQVALDTIRTGGGLRRSRYPVDFRFEGPQPPQLRPLRQATFLLLMEAMVNREESRPHDAAASLITCCRLTESLKNEPIIMSHAVRSIGQSLIVRRLEWLLNVSTLPPDDLETFASALAGATDTAALHRALATALCQGSDCFRQISSGKFRMSDAVDLVPPRPWWFTPAGYIYEAAGRVPSDWLTFLELQYAAIGAANCPLPDRLRASEDLAEQMHALSRWRLPVRLFLIGSSPELIKRDLARIALVESARTALVIEQHRDPAEIPTDPFDGRPLRYKKLPNGYVVYSVGEDGKDDGGDETKDITFTVER